MSSTVIYGSRRFKVPVSPGTSSGQVRQQVCASSSSSPEENYALEHQRKPVDLALPVRLSGSVNNAQLELVKAKKSQLASANTPVRIKIKLPSSPDFVGTFPGDTSVEDVLKQQKSNGELSSSGVAVAPTKSSAALGGSGLMFTFQPSKANTASQVKSPVKTEKTTISSPQNTQHTTSSAPTGTLTAERDARVVDPQKFGSLPQEEPPEEPSQTQFMAYYNQLKTQAEPPLLSKSTKEAMAKAQRAAIETTTCRIKFPDQTMSEGKFRNGETGEDVFKFSSMYLHDPKMKYELVSIKPSFVLTSDMSSSTQSGQRAMSLFRATDKVNHPYLNEKARRLMPTPPPAAAGSPKPANSQPPAPEKPKDEPSAGPKKKKGIPKWLKSHKK